MSQLLFKEIKTGLFALPNRSSTWTRPLFKGTSAILLSVILSTKLMCTCRQISSTHPNPNGQTVKSSFETQWMYNNGVFRKNISTITSDVREGRHC